MTTLLYLAKRALLRYLSLKLHLYKSELNLAALLKYVVGRDYTDWCPALPVLALVLLAASKRASDNAGYSNTR
jgi:hypothetical protein